MQTVRLRIQAPAGQCQFSARLDGYSPWRYLGETVVVAGQTTQTRIVLEEYPRVIALVVDEKGRPVSGAMVNNETAATDEAGRFETRFPLDDPPGQWIVRHVPRNLAAVVGAKLDTTPIQISLKPALRLSGRITDPNGNGIPAARVGLCLSANRTLIPYGHETTTDSQGYYEIGAVVPERDGFEYRISVHASGYERRTYDRIMVAGEPGTSVTGDPIVMKPANQSVSGILVDADGVPGARRPIFARGKGQPSRVTATDRNGRFVIRRICEGPIRIQASFDSWAGGSATTEVQAGQNDVRIVLPGRLTEPQSLLGKHLPPLKTITPSVSDGTEGKALLLCFFDMEQRPSRGCIRQLAQRADELKAKDVSVTAIHANQIDAQKLADWIADEKVAFPIVTTETGLTRLRRDWGVQSLPWLILTDREQRVIAEGLSLNELSEKMAPADNK